MRERVLQPSARYYRRAIDQPKKDRARKAWEQLVSIRRMAATWVQPERAWWTNIPPPPSRVTTTSRYLPICVDNHSDHAVHLGCRCARCVRASGEAEGLLCKSTCLERFIRGVILTGPREAVSAKPLIPRSARRSTQPVCVRPRKLSYRMSGNVLSPIVPRRSLKVRASPTETA